MKNLILVTIMVFSTTFAANAALDAEDVQAAMLDRAAESKRTLDELKEDLADASQGDKDQIRRQIRTELARARQLVSFARIVPRLPERRLELIIAKYGLSVSPN